MFKEDGTMLFKKREIEATNVEPENDICPLTDGQMEKVSGGTGENESKGKPGDILLPEIE